MAGPDRPSAVSDPPLRGIPEQHLDFFSALLDQLQPLQARVRLYQFALVDGKQSGTGENGDSVAGSIGQTL
jgi:hypothetical protein